MRKPLIAVVAVIALLGSGLVAGAAAGLGPLASGIFSAAVDVTYDPAVRSASDLVLTSAGDPATVSALTLTITGPDLANLDGQSVSIALLDSAGAQVQLVTATLASGGNLAIGATSATVSLPVAGSPLLSSFASWAAFVAGEQVLGPIADPTARTVTVGSGTLTVPVTPIDWTFPVANASDDGIVINSIVLASATTAEVCIAIEIQAFGQGNSPRTWGILLDYSAGPFWGTAPLESRMTNTVIASTTHPVQSLGGTPGNEQIRRDDGPLTVTVCLDDPPLPARPEAYTVSPQSRGTWTSEEACVRRTVTGNGSYPFYIGWSVDLDLTDAFAKLRVADVDAPRSFSVQPNTVSPAFDGGVTSYTVTNVRDTAIAGTESRVVELCAAR